MLSYLVQGLYKRLGSWSRRKNLDQRIRKASNDLSLVNANSISFLRKLSNRYKKFKYKTFVTMLLTNNKTLISLQYHKYQV